MCRVRHASNGRPNDWVPRRVKKHREVGDGPATGNGDLMKRIELTAEERRALAAATKNFVRNWIRRMRAHKSYLAGKLPRRSASESGDEILVPYVRLISARFTVSSSGSSKRRQLATNWQWNLLTLATNVLPRSCIRM